MRVVSLLPSATELLCAIPGGEALLVGRSHECDFPARIADRPVLTAQRTLGGTSAEIDAQVKDALGQSGASSLYHLDEALLHELKPDVILTQDLCAVCSIDLNAVRRVAGQLSPVPIIVSDSGGKADEGRARIRELETELAVHRRAAELLKESVRPKGGSRRSP